MTTEEHFQSYAYLSTLGTGSLSTEHNVQYIIVPFGKYTVKVRVDERNEFLGIEEISVNKEFRTIEQRNLATGSYDVEHYYISDDE